MKGRSIYELLMLVLGYPSDKICRHFTCREQWEVEIQGVRYDKKYQFTVKEWSIGDISKFFLSRDGGETESEMSWRDLFYYSSYLYWWGERKKGTTEAKVEGKIREIIYTPFRILPKDIVFEEIFGFAGISLSAMLFGFGKYFSKKFRAEGSIKALGDRKSVYGRYFFGFERGYISGFSLPELRKFYGGLKQKGEFLRYLKLQALVYNGREPFRRRLDGVDLVQKLKLKELEKLSSIASYRGKIPYFHGGMGCFGGSFSFEYGYESKSSWVYGDGKKIDRAVFFNKLLNRVPSLLSGRTNHELVTIVLTQPPRTVLRSKPFRERSSEETLRRIFSYSYTKSDSRNGKLSWPIIWAKLIDQIYSILNGEDGDELKAMMNDIFGEVKNKNK